MVGFTPLWKEGSQLKFKKKIKLKFVFTDVCQDTLTPTEYKKESQNSCAFYCSLFISLSWYSKTAVCAKLQHVSHLSGNSDQRKSPYA